MREQKNPEIDTVFALHRLFSVNELALLEKRYRDGTIGYKESKELLVKNIKKFVRPLREKREKIAEGSLFENMEEVMAKGKKRARDKVEKKMKKVREKVGVISF